MRTRGAFFVRAAIILARRFSRIFLRYLGSAHRRFAASDRRLHACRLLSSSSSSGSVRGSPSRTGPKSSNSSSSRGPAATPRARMRNTSAPPSASSSPISVSKLRPNTANRPCSEPSPGRRTTPLSKSEFICSCFSRLLFNIRTPALRTPALRTARLRVVPAAAFAAFAAAAAAALNTRAPAARANAAPLITLFAPAHPTAHASSACFSVSTSCSRLLSFSFSGCAARLNLTFT
mmetsp:Transcript_11342/g.30560  ORF Transcript_11342/g.30560 Transcript_11342/m.30560 type:complete len:234 (-) Transcript_11342:59-760(-)